MGFQTPQHPLSKYLEWVSDGTIQLPDFQRGYKWDDERIRSLLVTILRGHPLGVVMLLRTGNDQIHFKPRPLSGARVPAGKDADMLLLDGQQRLTSLTQALTGDGLVATMDARGKLMNRRYYVDMETALEGEDRLDDAVVSIPGDGLVTSNFGRDVVKDLSTPEKERAANYFPLRLLYAGMEATSWLFDHPDRQLVQRFMNSVITPASTYTIPAISLDEYTSKAAVATVFEKVNTGGLALNVFELLTATFAGDKGYYDTHGTSFRLSEDWKATQQLFSPHPSLAGLENTDFLQAVTLLTTRARNLAHSGTGRAPAVSAKREDILKLELNDYLRWVTPLRDAFIWASGFLADQYIFDTRFLPYPKQLVPLATLKVVLGDAADLISVKERITQWYWCGILGELYGSAIETRFVRDLEQVPPWARGLTTSAPNTVVDATFVESRLHSLRTRGAAAYKGVYALTLRRGARDWMYGQHLDKVQYSTLAVDVHHIFPRSWCEKNEIDDERRESIINKTAISAKTNRTIGGAAPSSYLQTIERSAGLAGEHLDEILDGHLIPAAALRSDDFDCFFVERRERLCHLIESAMGKQVPRDASAGHAEEASGEFEAEFVVETPEEDDELVG